MKIVKRKAMKYKLSALLIISLLVSTLSGQQFSEKRTFSKSVKVRGDETVEISNKYGTIHIVSWNLDSVSIRAEVEAFASSQSRIGKMLEGIEISISGTDYLIRAQTVFSQSINMLFENFKGMTNKLIPYESRVQINYFVSMPENLNLRIENKYGDVYMENNTNNIDITISNGSLKANSIRKASSMSLTFCDATISKLGEATMDVSFSEVFTGSAGSLRINSISSRLDIRECESLNIDSKRDKFFTGPVESVRGTSYFTDFRFDQVSEELNLTLKYGSLSADHISKPVQIVNINSSYSDVSLSFDPGLSYYIDIRHLNAFVSVPQKNSSLEKKMVSDEKNEYITYGNVGKAGSALKVRIDANRGNIYVK
jgi:hypothetical protein